MGSLGQSCPLCLCRGQRGESLWAALSSRGKACPRCGQAEKGSQAFKTHPNEAGAKYIADLPAEQRFKHMLGLSRLMT